MPSGREVELNEVGWWSLWTDVHWMGTKSFIMISSDFDEYFFNRAGFVECGDVVEAIPKAEATFETLGRPPCFSVQQDCSEAIDALKSRGYATVDEMSVLQLGRFGFKTATGLTILSGKDISTADWSAAYSFAFYGDSRAREAVSLIANRLKKEPSVTLLEGKKDGRTIGILAAFRTPRLLGVYCVGTLDRYRGTGVAGSLIQKTSTMASAEGRNMILQTMLSDKIEDFYTNGGFRRLYLKEFLRRALSSSDPQRRQRF